MFMKYSNSLFFVILVLSTFIIISSSSFIIMWMAIEINLMSFIPFLMYKNSFYCSTSSMKYFIVQAMASIIFISSFILFLNSNYMSININNELLTIAMLIKSGIPPFHFWFPQIMELISFFEMFIIATWQKIAPLIIISLFSSKMIILAIVLSSIVGMLGGLNQNSIPKIIAYSSIANNSWALMSLIINFKLWTVFFCYYSLMVMLICYFMNYLNVKKVMTMKNSLNNFYKMLFCFTILSLAGLPPFMGFFNKMVIIFSMVMVNNSMLIMVPMILASVISLIFYMKMSYSMIFSFNSFILFNKNLIKDKKKNFLLFLIVLNMMFPLIFMTM